MKKKKLTYCFILGTRPEIIKMYPLINEVQRRKLPFEIIHTGQHYSAELRQHILRDLKLPAVSKMISLKNKNVSSILGEMIQEISHYLLKNRNSQRVIIVQGDTNSTLAGALVANKCKIPLVHVEAGFRSGLKSQPEEINRILIDQLSDLNFAVDKRSMNNLKKENLKHNAFKTSNTAYAAANYMHLEAKSFTKNPLPPYRLMTIHRAQNADNAKRLKIIWESAVCLSKELPLVWVMHPRTYPQLEKVLKKKILLKKSINAKDLVSPGLIYVTPQSYRNFFTLLSQCKSILSDSGGIIDESIFLGKPYICLRNETEQSEPIAKKRMVLISPDLSSEAILGLTRKFEKRSYPFLSIKEKVKLINAPKSIIDKIENFYERN